MKPQKTSGNKAIVADTNVLIHDPNSIDTLRNDTTLFLHWATIHELDGLKSNPDIGYDAREAIRRIEKICLSGDNSLVLVRNTSFRGLKDLDRKKADHQIIATAFMLKDRVSYSKL